MIDLLVLYTNNLDSAHAFYSDLGLAFAKEQHGTGPEHYAAQLQNGAILELYPATPRRPANAGLRLGLTLPAGTRAPGRRQMSDPDGRALILTLTEQTMTTPEIETAVTERFGPTATADIHRHPTGALSVTIHAGGDTITLDGKGNSWGWTLNPAPDSAGHEHTATSLTNALDVASSTLR
ncbi:VOC family protein [Streptomyces alkaliterrae]|uniref:Glyoxalase/bleomycin resistance/dioxygenase family protein n=1 Tax=Streptomyces alkaliterrae TaxID=2213162 RepID=A0A5P0YR40_9ACTN|nr:glyoxalase/bleomycin resistance/dioxygenase family protein [Streptomyces alkaliterrae]MBB1260170.1 glyoxalase/bleomycin resistance/dioxygenase family protein [Streptomyces alkaliterrae]MQS02087.1 glyoxalase/bleomycin resistance/dioxygenase family protein [Streptomyces alkaliterrae]